MPEYDDPHPSLLDDVAPEVASGVLTTSLWILLVAVVVLIGVMLWAHAARVSRNRRIARILEPLRPRLLALAADEEPDDDSVAAWTLRRGSARVVDRTILDLLAKVRGGAAGALVDILDQHGTVDSAVRGVRAFSPTTRARSAQVLGATRRPQHVPALAGMLTDRDRAVRSTAARALGVVGDATYADAVLRSVREVDGSPGVPFYIAADALLAMGDDVREAVRRGLDDADPGVRFVAATVAARGGMATLLPRVRQLFATDSDEPVRIAAAKALGVIGDAGVVDDLGRALGPHEPAGVRHAVARALGELGSPAAIELLEPLLSDADRRLAGIAATALTTVGRRGETVLVNALTRDPADTAPAGQAPAGQKPAGQEPAGHAPDSRSVLAARAALGAVSAIGIRDRRPDLYELAATRWAGPDHAGPDRTEPPR